MLDILKDYASKRLDLLKMEATEKGVTSAGILVIASLLAVFGIFFLILLNIGLALLIGNYLGNNSYGFLIVAGFYLLFVIIFIVAFKPIKHMIANKILKTFNNPE